jgi:hypothetical protein
MDEATQRDPYATRSRSHFWPDKRRLKASRATVRFGTSALEGRPSNSRGGLSGQGGALAYASEIPPLNTGDLSVGLALHVFAEEVHKISRRKGR